jgi:hypothetical protein
MAVTIEINLRISGVHVRTTAYEPKRHFRNADTRFLEVIQLPALPKVGDNLTLSTGEWVFDALVKRFDWHDDTNRFVVTCHYAKRSMTVEEYDSAYGS